MRSRQQTGVASCENGSRQMRPRSHQPTFDLCVARQPSLQLKQLHVKNERGVWGDDSGVACRSVSHVWCAGEFRPLAEAHLCYSFFPAFYNLHPSDLELEGFVPVSRGVKLFPVLQHAYVMNNTCLAFLWKCPPITGRYGLDFYAHGCATSEANYET